MKKVEQFANRATRRKFLKGISALAAILVIASPFVAPVDVQSKGLIQLVQPAAATTVIDFDGLRLTFSGALENGIYVDEGGPWVNGAGSPVTLLSIDIAPGESANLYLGVGGIPTPMVDPPGLTAQGCDDRVSSGGAQFGPGLIYDADLGEDLPLVVDAASGPKTIWAYRGKDVVQTGGPYNGTWVWVQCTVVDSTPAVNAIKPTGYAQPGGKTLITTDDIDYNAFTPTALPKGAVEKDWSARGYLKRPLIQSGVFASGAQLGICNSEMWQDPFPGDQCHNTYNLIIGAISNSAVRNTLINRIVRSGMDLYVQSLYDLPIFLGGGAFGPGGAILHFFAGYFLDNAAMLTTPDTVLITQEGTTVAYYAESGLPFIGDPTVEYPFGKPLYGNINPATYPTGPYHWNNDTRDANGIGNAYTISTGSGIAGNAQGGSTTTIQLAAGTSFGAENPHNYTIYNQAADEWQMVDTWDNTTKIITLYSGIVWSVAPTAGTPYKFSNGGTYELLNATPMTIGAIAIVCAGTDVVNAWNAFDSSDAFLFYCGKWDTDSGRLDGYPCDPNNPPNPYSMTAGAIAGRVCGDPNQNWASLFLAVARPSWPVQS